MTFPWPTEGTFKLIERSLISFAVLTKKYSTLTITDLMNHHANNVKVAVVSFTV